jgi:hypothetical protein
MHHHIKITILNEKINRNNTKNNLDSITSAKNEKCIIKLVLALFLGFLGPFSKNTIIQIFMKSVGFHMLYKEKNYIFTIGPHGNSAVGCLSLKKDLSMKPKTYLQIQRCYIPLTNRVPLFLKFVSYRIFRFCAS